MQYNADDIPSTDTTPSRSISTPVSSISSMAPLASEYQHDCSAEGADAEAGSRTQMARYHSLPSNSLPSLEPLEYESPSSGPMRLPQILTPKSEPPPRLNLPYQQFHCANSHRLSPTSPSYPFSRMGLRENSISPLPQDIFLRSLHEKTEYAMSMAEVMENEVPFWGVNQSQSSNITLPENIRKITDVGLFPDVDSEMKDYLPIEVDPTLCSSDKSASYNGYVAGHPSPSEGFHMIRRRHTDGLQLETPTWGGGGLSPPFPNSNRGFSAEYNLGSLSCDISTKSFYPSLAVSPPTSAFSEPESRHLGRRISNKRRRGHGGSSSLCTYCISPDIPVEGQKITLDQLPVELLVDIFEYAFLSPVKPSSCKHRPKTHPFGLARRATVNSYCPQGNTGSTHSSTSYSSPPSAASSSRKSKEEDILPKISDDLRVYRAHTLLRIALTCRRFNEILLVPYYDSKLWRSAARWCWSWLPENLADVQGRNKTSQTTWRNLVGVFMRSENGLFKQKGGGRGGVESFGGKKGCTPAVPWKVEERLRRSGERNEKSKLLLVCAQPGPDIFHVTPDKDTGGYTISLSLRGGIDYFVKLDQYGRFGKRPARLPGGLKRSERDVTYFPPNIFEVEGDRYQLVKVRRGSSPCATLKEEFNPAKNFSNCGPPKPPVEEIVTWDLKCVPEYEADPDARVARCASQGGWLVFNLFTHRDRDDSNIETVCDPPEDQILFCIKTIGYPRCENVNLTTKSTPAMSEKKRGKMKATDINLEEDEEHRQEPTTVHRWQREFEYEHAQDFPPSQHLHYVICNLELNTTKVVALIRWNIRTPESNEELVDRQFQVLDLKTGEVVRILQFPNLYWDHRHNDMSMEYNEMRIKKMSKLYNYLGSDESMGAGNRCTRIHEDQFILTDERIISGSHDYCNWVWDLDQKDESGKGGVIDSGNNSAGTSGAFRVLDDFYWEDEGSKKLGESKAGWNTLNERAGWWVKTPNQVLCFWHGISASEGGRYFAACRSGRMFVWDLEDEKLKVHGFSCAPGTHPATTSLAEPGSRPASPPPPKTNRWIGRLADHAKNLKHRLKSWFVWEDVLPEQGLWLMYDDHTTVYLDRSEILEACGLKGRRRWTFNRSDFTFDDSGSESESDTEDLNHCRPHKYLFPIGAEVESSGNEFALTDDGEYDEYEREEDHARHCEETVRERGSERKRRRKSSILKDVGQWDPPGAFMFATEKAMDD